MIGLPATVPVEPGADEARRWLQDELAKQPYQAAKPTPLDLAAQAFFDWLRGLFGVKGDPTPTVLLLLALVVVVALVVVALVVFGVPRLNRRSGAGSADALFGDTDRRTAAQLRAAARAALGRGEWALAVLEGFRAVARGLDERTLVALFPGTTATGFARAAARVLPEEAPALAAAARSFDAVRYAAGAASRDEAEAVLRLDDRVAAARPAPAPVPQAPVS